MPNETTAFDRFIQLLDQLAVAPSGAPPGDAIDAVLAGPARRTEVVPLRDSPVVQKFRNDLIDGLIRADSINQLLRLANLVLERLPLMGI